VVTYQVVNGPYINTATATALDRFVGQTTTDQDVNRHIGQANGEDKTPGFWKTNATNNNAAAWPKQLSGALVYSPSQTLESVFDVPDSLGLDNTILTDALDLIAAGAQSLLRHGVAALLNATHPVVAYPLTARQVIDQVNASLASRSSSQIETLKNQLDAWNNLGSDIDQNGNGGNVAPIASNDSATTSQNTPVTINVLANDTDANGNALIVTALTQPSSGSVAINPNQTLTFTPAAGFTGAASFTYRASDGRRLPTWRP
jgi:hypothetical protein